MSTDTICRYFQFRFGDIKWLSIHNSSQLRFAFLKFRVADSAQKASDQKQHMIAGHIVNVVIADLTQEPQCSFLSLNDECINKILKNLEWKDLCKIANMCSRLRELARKVFSSIYDGTAFTLMESGETIEDLVRNFGSTMHQDSRTIRWHAHSTIIAKILSRVVKFRG